MLHEAKETLVPRNISLYSKSSVDHIRRTTWIVCVNNKVYGNVF